MAKATSNETEAKPLDPVEHVETLLNAEGPIARLEGYPQVTAESAKLSDMMDNLDKLEDFEQLAKVAEAQIANEISPKHPAIDPLKEPVKLPPPRPRVSPRQAEPKAPKAADVPDYEPASTTRRRRRAGGSGEPVALPSAGPSTKTELTGEHVASLIKMTHAVGSTVLGPAFSISDESAKAIGDAAMPVLEDFGVQVASRAVHLLMLVSTVAMIEGPIMMTVYMDMRARAEMQRSGLSTMTMSTGGKYQEASPNDIASAISQATGVMVGNAPE